MPDTQQALWKCWLLLFKEGKWQSDRRQSRQFKCSIKVGHSAELSLRIVFAKVNSTILLHNDSLVLSSPHPSVSVSSVKGLFYSLSSLPKTFGVCTKEEIWNFQAAISRNSKLLLQDFPATLTRVPATHYTCVWEFLKRARLSYTPGTFSGASTFENIPEKH